MTGFGDRRSWWVALSASLTIILALTPSASAPGGDIIWVRQMGVLPADPYIGEMYGTGVAIDGSGEYVVGYTYSALPGHTIGKVCPGTCPDAFLLKYDTNGNLLWTGEEGSDRITFAWGVAVDGSGVYISGTVDGDLPGQTSMGGIDGFLIKYTLSGSGGLGTWLWMRQFGTPGTDNGFGVSVDATGVYVVGGTDGVFPGQTPVGGSDAFLVKYDTNGNSLWTRQFGTSADETAYSVAAGSSGVYLAGYTDGSFPGYTNAGLGDAFLGKYDANGNPVWTPRQLGTPGEDIAFGVAVDASGAYITGYVWGTLPGQTSAGSYDAFLRKYDNSGNILWTRQFGTSSPDVARGVAVSSTGVYVAGHTPGTFSGQQSAGGEDAFLRKYDTTGKLKWTSQFGTSADDEANGDAVGASGLYVAGSTRGAFPSQTLVGTVDAFVAKVQP